MGEITALSLSMSDRQLAKLRESMKEHIAMINELEMTMERAELLKYFVDVSDYCQDLVPFQLTQSRPRQSNFHSPVRPVVFHAHHNSLSSAYAQL
jgi:hypothetical protein